MTPTDIRVRRSEGTCTITWSDANVQRLTLADLRRLCPCALCADERRKREESGGLLVFKGSGPTAELEGIDPIGGYALRFRWADGHDAGIYSYDYLRSLGGAVDSGPEPATSPD